MKILTPNKLLTRLSILLEQIKAEKIHRNKKIKSNKYYIFCISIIKSQKSLQQFNQVIAIMKENMIVTRDPKTFCFSFDWLRYVDVNLKHEIEFIISNNEYLAENTLKTEIEQFLLKFKHGKDIHEHGKQQNE